MLRITSICLFLALIAHLDLELLQINVKIASLNGNLEEEICVDKHIGFVSKRQEDKVYLLKRSIYGFKQSSRLWYFVFPEAIISFGLNMIFEDYCVHVKKTTKGIIFLTLYVDDILLAGNNMEMIQTT